jgi:transcriptional regulator with XRE-family HTH domain
MPHIEDDARTRIASTIGSRVKAARAELRMTLRELGRRIGVSASYLSAVERGADKANVDIIVGIALFFPRLNVDWLVTGRGQMVLDEPDGGAINNYDMDLDAITYADWLSNSWIRDAELGNAPRFIVNRAFNIKLLYSIYMSHFASLKAQGVAEGEARRLAERECVLVGKRELAAETA